MIQRKLTPRLVTATEAAHYCGLNPHTFKATCPVGPIGLGVKGAVKRYDVRELDTWIDRLGRPAEYEVDADKLMRDLEKGCAERAARRKPKRSRDC